MELQHHVSAGMIVAQVYVLSTVDILVINRVSTLSKHDK